MTQGCVVVCALGDGHLVGEQVGALLDAGKHTLCRGDDEDGGQGRHAHLVRAASCRESCCGCLVFVNIEG